MNANDSNYNPLFMQRAIALSETAYKTGKGLPIGCVIVKAGKIVGEGHNEIFYRKNPTSHGEMMAIENACARSGNILLEDCELYTTLEPCPMCLGAIYWAKISVVYFANTSSQASEIGFDDSFLFEELIKKPLYRKIPGFHKNNAAAFKVMQDWKMLGTENAQPWQG